MRKYLVSNKTYDLIFIDDVIYGVDSEEYSAEMYERLTGYNSFKTIIMLSNDKEKISVNILERDMLIIL